MQTPKYHLITYGCQMNKSDSERIATIFQNLGFVATDQAEDSDVILINTCSVRKSADDRVFGKIRQFKKLKEKNPKLIIAVTGCLPGRDRDQSIRKKMKIIDLYFPTVEMTQLPRWISELRPDLVNSPDYIEDYLKIKPNHNNTRQAFVSIQTGCNNFCTYCVVPFARGLEKNRPVKDIMDEVRDLASRGYVEIVLLGQTVNSYQAPDPENFSQDNPYKDHFASLIWEVDQVDGIKRQYFTAPHPMYMTDEVIDAMTLPSHLNYLHLPVQCGDNEVLRRMNRRYTVEQYEEVISRVRDRLPSITIGTDIIVGFCGESPEAFQRTVDLYNRVGFDISYTAKYSVRSGTAAWRAFEDDVSFEEKKRRWENIQKLMEDLTYKKNQRFVGEVASVLVERHEAPKITDEMLVMPDKVLETLKSQSGFCYGNSRDMKLVRFVGSEEFVSSIVNVKITRADKWILEGEIV